MSATFPGVIAFAFMASMLIVGTVLRARVPFLRGSLVPASLIGGVVGFCLLLLGVNFGAERADFAVLSFHFFTLSFMSLVLTGNDNKGASAGGSITQGGLWIGIIWTMSLVMQGLLGLFVVQAYNGVAGESLSEFLGLMVTHGFTQGPGQALATGSIWQDEYGVANAVNFGIIYASAGFVAAFVLGVPAARWAVRKGLNSNTLARLDDDFKSGVFGVSRRETAGEQVTHPANVDSLAFHLGVLGIAYLITNEWLHFIGPLAAQVPFGQSNFGVLFRHELFFLHGLLTCVILRALLNRWGLGHFIDNPTQRRITGSSVDFMVVGTLMSVQVALLAEFWVPIVLVCVSVTLATAVLCFGFGRLVRQHGVERAVTTYGCCCGSTGSGIVLLRILDPDLSTPIARELAFFNVAIIAISFHILTLKVPFLPSLPILEIVLWYGGTFVVGALAVVFGFRRLREAAAPATVALSASPPEPE